MGNINRIDTNIQNADVFAGICHVCNERKPSAFFRVTDSGRCDYFCNDCGQELWQREQDELPLPCGCDNDSHERVIEL